MPSKASFCAWLKGRSAKSETYKDIAAMMMARMAMKKEDDGPESGLGWKEGGEEGNGFEAEGRE
jgi:predicted Zn-dependent peptidase